MLRVIISVALLLCAAVFVALTSPHARADSGTSPLLPGTEAAPIGESTMLPDEEQEAAPTAGVPTPPPLPMPTTAPDLVGTPTLSFPSATPEATSATVTPASPTPEPSPSTEPGTPSVESMPQTPEPTRGSEVAPTSEPVGTAAPTPAATGTPEDRQKERSRPVVEQASEVLPSVVEPEEERTPLERVRDVLLLLNFL